MDGATNRDIVVTGRGRGWYPPTTAPAVLGTGTPVGRRLFYTRGILGNLG